MIAGLELPCILKVSESVSGIPWYLSLKCGGTLYLCTIRRLYLQFWRIPIVHLLHELRKEWRSYGTGRGVNTDLFQ